MKLGTQLDTLPIECSICTKPATDTLDDPEPLFTALAEAMVFFDGRIAEIAKPLSDREIEDLVKRCRREAHPQPGDSHNFEIPAWDATADLLERELRFRRIITVLVLEEALRSVSGISNEIGEQE